MVLFEVWSVGKKPFSEISNKEVIVKINSGYCQPPPPGCSRPIYQLMVNCWSVSQWCNTVGALILMFLLSTLGIPFTPSVPPSPRSLPHWMHPVALCYSGLEMIVVWQVSLEVNSLRLNSSIRICRTPIATLSNQLLLMTLCVYILHNHVCTIICIIHTSA